MIAKKPQPYSVTAYPVSFSKNTDAIAAYKTKSTRLEKIFVH